MLPVQHVYNSLTAQALLLVYIMFNELGCILNKRVNPIRLMLAADVALNRKT